MPPYYFLRLNESGLLFSNIGAVIEGGNVPFKLDFKNSILAFKLY